MALRLSVFTEVTLKTPFTPYHHHPLYSPWQYMEKRKLNCLVTTLVERESSWGATEHPFTGSQGGDAHKVTTPPIYIFSNEFSQLLHFCKHLRNNITNQCQILKLFIYFFLWIRLLFPFAEKLLVKNWNCSPLSHQTIFIICIAACEIYWKSP